MFSNHAPRMHEQYYWYKGVMYYKGMEDVMDPTSIPFFQRGSPKKVSCTSEERFESDLSRPCFTYLCQKTLWKRSGQLPQASMVVWQGNVEPGKWEWAFQTQCSSSSLLPADPASPPWLLEIVSLIPFRALSSFPDNLPTGTWNLTLQWAMSEAFLQRKNQLGWWMKVL